jgi:hypothetical protein
LAAAASISANSASVRRVAIDFARELSFADTGEGVGRIDSCGLSLAEAIQDVLLGRKPLQSLDAPTALTVPSNAGVDAMARGKSPQNPLFTSGDAKRANR